MTILMSSSLSELQSPPLRLRAAQRNSRGARVVALLVVVVVLSAMDLAMTLHWMQTSGMYESNPLVASLARATGSPIALAAYKTLSVLLSSGLLFRLRRHGQAELGAWMSAIILVALTARWVNYTHWSTQVDPQLMHQLAGDDRNWVRLN